MYFWRCVKTARVLILFTTILLAQLFPGSFYSPALAAQEPPSPARLENIFREFEAKIRESLESFGIPGMAVAVVQGDEVIYSRGFGFKETGGTEAVEPDTVFQIGSTSKAFTATLVAFMVEEEKLGWKDPVISHLPYFAMADPWVTKEFQIRDLMAQHSGMPPYAGDILAILGYSRDEIIRSTAHIAPVYSFRSEFSYVNNLWLTAAAVVEAKTGRSWEQNLQERILDPLGMTGTSCSKEALFRSSDTAVFHILDGGKVKPIPRDWIFFNWPYIYAPAGGINSNIVDMAKWLRFQLGEGTFEGKKILGSENLAATHLPQTPTPGGTSAYCMGWVKTDHQSYPLIWHNGATSGCATFVAIVPELDLGVVILSNLVTPAPDALGMTFLDIYSGTTPSVDHLEKSLEAWKKNLAEDRAGMIRPKDAYPPLPNESYLGIYESPFFGTACLLQDHGSLVLRVGPKGATVTLKPWNRDTFRFEFEGMGDEDMGTVRFEISPEGEAAAFYIVDTDGELLSRFARKAAD